MTTQRQIRDALKAAISGLVPPGTHVHSSPRRQLGSHELPCVAIYGHQDRPVDPSDDHQRTHQRVYTVRCEVRVEAAPEDDATDELARCIRRGVLVEAPLGGLVESVAWPSQQWVGDEEGEDPMGGTALDFEFTYQFSPTEE